MEQRSNPESAGNDDSLPKRFSFSHTLVLLEIWAIYTEFLPNSQTIPALLIDAGNLCTRGLGSLDWSRLRTVGGRFLFSPCKFEGRIGFLMELQAEFQDSAQKTTAQSRADIGNEREFGFSFQCTRTHNFTRFCAPWWQLNCWRSFSLQHCLQPHAKQN